MAQLSSVSHPFLKGQWYEQPSINPIYFLKKNPWDQDSQQQTFLYSLVCIFCTGLLPLSIWPAKSSNTGLGFYCSQVQFGPCNLDPCSVIHRDVTPQYIERENCLCALKIIQSRKRISLYSGYTYLNKCLVSVRVFFFYSDQKMWLFYQQSLCQQSE